MVFPKADSIELVLGFPELCLLEQLGSDCIQLDVNAEDKNKVLWFKGQGKTEGK